MNAAVKSTAESLLEAQDKASALFDAVVAGGLIRAGRLESELSQDIHELARSEFGLRRHWHKRIARTGPNTLLTYHDDPQDRRIAEDDTVYLDFGPVFAEWEADFGRTYALGSDPDKHRLVADLAVAFRRGKDLYVNTPTLTAGQLYDYVVHLGRSAGWEFGAPTAGHLIGHFPHERAPGNTRHFSICHGNELRLREPDAKGALRHWILEIHFIDRARQFGGFYEQLLTA
jgi:Xaa-Pro aminopeptidase